MPSRFSSRSSITRQVRPVARAISCATAARLGGLITLPGRNAIVRAKFCDSATARAVSTAATLHQAGKTNIQTAAEAAKALEPIAGHFAFLLFGIGIVGTGLLAIPVLAGSAAYAVGESRGWN